MSATAQRDSKASSRVLVVEDDMMVAMLVEDWLDDLGYQVVGPFASLGDAVVAARDHQFDAAVLDVNLDGERVFPVAEVLAARHIPFVFATGYGAAALVAPWTGRPILAKPYYQRDLARHLAQLIPAGSAPA